MCKVKKQYPKLIAIFTKSFPEFTILHFCEVVRSHTYRMFWAFSHLFPHYFLYFGGFALYLQPC